MALSCPRGLAGVSGEPQFIAEIGVRGSNCLLGSGTLQKRGIGVPIASWDTLGHAGAPRGQVGKLALGEPRAQQVSARPRDRTRPDPGHSLTRRVHPVHGGLEQRHDHQQPQCQRGPGAPSARSHCSSPVPAPQCAPVRPGVSKVERRVGPGLGGPGSSPAQQLPIPALGSGRRRVEGAPLVPPGSGLRSGGAPVVPQLQAGLLE